MGKFEKGNKFGHRFSATDQPANPGRKPTLKSIPPDAREKVYAALYHALTLPDQKTAAEYLNKAAEELPECGYLIQVYAKGMMGKTAGIYTADILDRLFGKPKQTTENIIGTRDRAAMQIVVGTPEAAEGLRRALETGAQPAPPENEDGEE